MYEAIFQLFLCQVFTNAMDIFQQCRRGIFCECTEQHVGPGMETGPDKAARPNGTCPTDTSQPSDQPFNHSIWLWSSLLLLPIPPPPNHLLITISPLTTCIDYTSIKTSPINETTTFIHPVKRILYSAGHKYFVGSIMTIFSSVYLSPVLPLPHVTLRRSAGKPVLTVNTMTPHSVSPSPPVRGEVVVCTHVSNPVTPPPLAPVLHLCTAASVTPTA
jgi:hypothetical protein